MRTMGRPRKYTKKRLRESLEAYFNSISRTVTLTERVPTGGKDEWGHDVYARKDILTDDGQPIKVRQYEIAPTVGGICSYLGIHRSTWAEYCDSEKYPEFHEVTEWARELMHGYLEQALLSRSGKDLKGVVFALQNNYGYREKQEIEMGPKATRAMATATLTTAQRKELLEEISREVLGEETSDDG